jgi:hypothetical protein
VKTRKLLIVILAAVLLVAYYVLGTDYLKQRQEHAALASQITEAQGALAVIPPPPADLEQRLAAARTALAVVTNSFPARLNTTAIVNAVLRTAKDAGVKAIPLSTQAWTTESASNHDYSVFRLNLVASGSFAQLVDFLHRLETGKPETLVIKSLSIERAIGLPADVILVEANLAISVYARPAVAEQQGKVE